VEHKQQHSCRGAYSLAAANVMLCFIALTTPPWCGESAGLVEVVADKNLLARVDLGNQLDVFSGIGPETNKTAARILLSLKPLGVDAVEFVTIKRQSMAYCGVPVYEKAFSYDFGVQVPSGTLITFEGSRYKVLYIDVNLDTEDEVTVVSRLGY